MLSYDRSTLNISTLINAFSDSFWLWRIFWTWIISPLIQWYFVLAILIAQRQSVYEKFDLIAQKQSVYEKFDICGINFDTRWRKFLSVPSPFLEVGSR